MCSYVESSEETPDLYIADFRPKDLGFDRHLKFGNKYINVICKFILQYNYTDIKYINAYILP